MDVEKLQRINALASELRKHNFALSSDEAYQQAEQVYETGAVQQVVVEKPMQVQNSDALAMRRFEMMLEQNNKKYEQEFATYRNAINMLASQLEVLKCELAKTERVAASEKPKEKQAELKTEVKESHPRQGNFQPSDVDIQKMFYFGAKR